LRPLKIGLDPEPGRRVQENRFLVLFVPPIGAPRSSDCSTGSVPVCQHLSDVGLWHLQRLGAILVGVHPVVPVVRIQVNVMSPSALECFLHFICSLAVEELSVSHPLDRHQLRPVVKDQPQQRNLELQPGNQDEPLVSSKILHVQQILFHPEILPELFGVVTKSFVTVTKLWLAWTGLNCRPHPYQEFLPNLRALSSSSCTSQ